MLNSGSIPTRPIRQEEIARPYSFLQRVMAVNRPPSPAVLGRAEPRIATASPDDRTNTPARSEHPDGSACAATEGPN